MAACSTQSGQGDHQLAKLAGSSSDGCDHHAVKLDELELWHSGPEQSRCVETKCGAEPGIALRPSRVLFVCGRGSKHVGVGGVSGWAMGVLAWLDGWVRGRVDGSLNWQGASIDWRSRHVVKLE